MMSISDLAAVFQVVQRTQRPRLLPSCDFIISNTHNCQYHLEILFDSFAGRIKSEHSGNVSTGHIGRHPSYLLIF